MKIGAAGKWLNMDGTQPADHNFRVIRIVTLTKMTEKERQAALMEIVEHNLAAMGKVLLKISRLPTALKMWRFGSDVLPVYTHAIASKFYARPDVRDFIEHEFAMLGTMARTAAIRLSFHPGQFTVLGSPNPVARENSVREFEYHALMAYWMGYRTWHQDGFCINVHVGGKQVDPKVMRKSIKGLSQTAQNMMTLENDEFCWGAKEIVQNFGDLVPLVLDVHHYWISQHKYISPDSPNIDKIVETWRGVQPKLHLAMSHAHLIPENMQHKRLSLDQLMETGLKKGALRVHADAPWHAPTLDYVGKFLPRFDIMYEGRDKNIGQMIIAHHLGLTKDNNG